MTKLVSTERLRKKLALPCEPEIIDALDEALEETTEHLAGLVRVRTFDRAIYTDQFWVDQSEFPFDAGIPHRSPLATPTGDPYLYLKNAFLVDLETTPDLIEVEVKVAHFREDLTDPNIDTVTQDFILVNKERGTVRLTATDISRIAFGPRSFATDQVWMQVRYQAGFETETDDHDGRFYKAEKAVGDGGVPSWLQIAALKMGKEIYVTTQDFRDPSAQGGTDFKRDVSAVITSMETLINRHIRFIPSALKSKTE